MSEICWGLLPVEASSIYLPPYSLLGQINSKNKTGANICPAILKLLQNTFTINCPFDFHLRYTGSLKKPEIRPIIEGCSILEEKLSNIISISPRNDWLNPNYPVFQITTPYIFFSSNECELVQRFPRLLIGKGYPFRLIEGQFPIHSWRRPLSWAIEWVDVKKDIILKRGIPWFDLSFIGNKNKKTLNLKKQKLTKSLLDEIYANRDVTKYIRGTSKLMEL